VSVAKSQFENVKNYSWLRSPRSHENEKRIMSKSSQVPAMKIAGSAGIGLVYQREVQP